MNSPRKQAGAEDELMRGLSAVMLKDTLPTGKEKCPSADELCLFALGRVDAERRQELVAHLSSCDRCLDFLKKRRQRRSLVREGGLVFAAAAALVLAVWLGLRTPIHTANRTATVDLRPLSPTRGGEMVTTPGEIPAINGKIARMRLILPAGSEGKYECEILSGSRATILMRVSGETSFQNHQVVLDLPMRSSFEAGHYFLALSKQGDGWAYYHLVFK